MKSDGPDSYYSCIVAIACCVIFSLINGMGRMAALLLVDIMAVFNISREEASFPFVLCLCVKYVAGVVAGLLARKIGIRSVILLGCCLAFVGVGAGYFAQNILQITIFWGLLHGIGRGFATCLLPQVVNLYFIKHVCKAYGVVYAGSSCYGILLPPVVEYLLQVYGVPGTFLILSGIVLHCFAAAIFTKEPNFKGSNKYNEIEQGFNINKFSETSSNINQPKFDLESDKHLTTDGATKMKLQEFETQQNFDSLDNDYYFTSTHALLELSVGKSKNDQKETIKKGTERSFLEGEQNKLYNTFSYVNNKEEISVPKEKKSTSWLNELSIFLDPLYICISIFAGVANAFFSITSTVVADYAIDKGISVTGSTYLLMAYSVADLIGSIVFGGIIDFSGLPKIYFVVLGFFIFAGSFILLTLSKGLLMAMPAVMLDGISLGIMSSALPGMVTEYINKEKQTMAMSSLGVLFVPLSFTLSPLIGYFRDICGSYDYLEYLMFAVATSCGVLSLCMARIAKCRITK